MASRASRVNSTSRDRALDELYAASPAEFTSTRDALAKSLKAAGDVAGANDVKAQRKPTQIAYVLNQLARKHADDLAELVDVGRQLARAQRKALRGEAGHDLRDAIARQRSVVAALTAKTATLMGELGVSATGHLDEIAGALQAALVDPAVGEKLEEGRLDKVPAPAAGFPGASPQVEEVEPARERPTTHAHPPPQQHAPAHAPTKSDTAKTHAAKTHAAKTHAAKPNAHAHAHVKQRADAKAEAQARAEEKRRAAMATKERVERERSEALRLKREAAASSAEREAAAQMRAADEAERDADGRAAQAKKLHDDARALAAEAKRLGAEAKRIAHEADVARRNAERAATDSARAAKSAKAARSDAERAVKHARSVATRA